MTKHRCSKKIWPGRTSGCMCSRPATIERNGDWYCWQHDPEYIAKKTVERRAAWQAKMNREGAKYACIARNARLGKLITPELAELLEKVSGLVGGNKGWTSIGLFTSQDGERCLALAAKIREALDDSQA